MSSFTALAAVIRSTILADTGSGGVFETGGANKIVGAWTGDAPDETSYPYVVISSVSEEPIHDFEGEYDRVTVDLDLWTGRSAGLADAHAIRDRLRTLFSRVELTVSGFGTSVGLLEDSTTHDVDDETRQNTLTLRYDLEAE